MVPSAYTHYQIMGKRNVSERSLANLDPRNRYRGKIRVNFSILPETKQWLETSPLGEKRNASDQLDQVIARAKEWEKFNPESIQDAETPNNNSDELYQESREKVEEAIQILSAALKLKSNAGGAIKQEIREALKLLIGDD